jgi:hypothetical protein
MSVGGLRHCSFGDGPAVGDCSRASDSTSRGPRSRRAHWRCGACRDAVRCATLLSAGERVSGSVPGRLAQRESASFTPRRSLVRSQYRPPGRTWLHKKPPETPGGYPGGYLGVRPAGHLFLSFFGFLGHASFVGDESLVEQRDRGPGSHRVPCGEPLPPEPLQCPCGSGCLATVRRSRRRAGAHRRARDSGPQRR